MLFEAEKTTTMFDVEDAQERRCALNLRNKTIAVIGLGYVGLPLAVAFGKSRPVIGFDVREARVDELKSGFDRTRDDLIFTEKSAERRDSHY